MQLASQRGLPHTVASQSRGRPSLVAHPRLSMAASAGAAAASGRVFNFSAGPAVLPVEVLETAQRDTLNFGGSGMSVMEMSHRSKAFDGIIQAAEADLRALLSIPDNYKVLFVQGGASTQFAAIPLNFTQEGARPGLGAPLLLLRRRARRLRLLAAGGLRQQQHMRVVQLAPPHQHSQPPPARACAARVLARVSLPLYARALSRCRARLLPRPRPHAGDTVDYIVTGAWSKKAYEEAAKFGLNVNLVAKGDNKSVPPRDSWKLSPGAKYVHYCDNETIGGEAGSSPRPVLRRCVACVACVAAGACACCCVCCWALCGPRAQVQQRPAADSTAERDAPHAAGQPSLQQRLLAAPAAAALAPATHARAALLRPAPPAGRAHPQASSSAARRTWATCRSLQTCRPTSCPSRWMCQSMA